MKVRFLKKPYMNFPGETLHRDPVMEGHPLSRAEVRAIWNQLGATGSMWIERQNGQRVLCAQTHDDGPIHEIGRVANTVRVGGGDFLSDGSFRVRKLPGSRRRR